MPGFEYLELLGVDQQPAELPVVASISRVANLLECRIGRFHRLHLMRERLLHGKRRRIHVQNGCQHMVAAVWPGVIAVRRRVVADIETHQSEFLRSRGGL